MQIKFNRSMDHKTLDHGEIMGEPNTLDIGPFVDEGSGYIYLPADDIGLGPFWLQVKPDTDCAGMFSGFSSQTLPLEGTCVSIDPEIMINF